MNILVTGSTGFIGSNLCRALLEAGHRVRAFHRPTSTLRMLEGLEVEHALGDLTNPDTLRPALEGIEVVFHTAAYMGGSQPGKQYAVTVEGTRRLARAALEAGVRRLVQTSSVAALGVPALGHTEPVDEHHTWNYHPERYPYGYAKYQAELEIQKVVAQGLDAVIVNPSMVFGPGDIYRQTSSILRAIARRRLPATVEGGLNVVHIADVVAGHIAALERGRTGERYILAGDNMTHLAFAQLAARCAGVPAPALVVPGWLLRALAGPAGLLENFLNLPVSTDLFHLAGRYFYYTSAKARDQLGLPTHRPAEEALRTALDWFAAN
jgi:dihydroflavonol-4-reductase